MAEIALKVNGKSYGGWKSVRVTRGIEAVSGSFELSVSDRWDGQTAPWPIMEEDACTVTIGSVVVITGYVDRRKVSYSAEDHSLEVAGRDAAGMLVDCSAVLRSWEFKNLPLLTLAQKLAEPFGVTVALDSSVNVRTISARTGKAGNAGKTGGAGKLSGGLGMPKPPKKFSIDPGETAFEVLDRACRLAGVLPVSAGNGGILLTRAGNSRAVTELVEGQNILAASAEYDVAGRYRTYTVSAQHQGSDLWFGKQVAGVKGSATDENVKRTARTLVIRPENSATPESAKVRAAWEAKVRAARGDTVTVTVQGWTQGDGSLWPINALVRVRSPLLGINGDMLITQAQLELGDQSGTTTQLTLRRPDAFLPEPAVSSGSTAYWKEIEKGVK